ncbi:MAG: response regulator [Candidatus Omnitrophica bacterium]|nr:response regulator [Candidatus Omnitrophota bacterium]
MATILIIDDDEILHKFLRQILGKEGHQVEEAFDGMTGLEMARSCKPDLILLDLELPRLNGHKVCQILKADKNYQSIPIIMMTASLQHEDKQWAEKTGANHYFTKPFDLEQLTGTIKELLAQAQNAEG